jgi:tetratricopeptide (TPR) repeat protein
MSEAVTADPAGQALKEELFRDLRTIDLPPGLMALELRNEPLLGLAPPVLLIPVSHAPALMRPGRLNPEAVAIGLRESVEALRRSQPTTLLAETLLTLARATRSYEGLEERLRLALEAVQIFRDLGRESRLARAYMDVGDILKQGEAAYDALRAFELGIALALKHGDRGAAAAGRYHSAVICRSLGLAAEALHLLKSAHAALATRTVPDEWAQRIRSESVINLITLGQDDEALARLDEWLAEPPKFYGPWLYRADLRRRRHGPAAALTDYVQAATAAAAEISGSVSGRFRRLDRERLDPVFDAALSGAVAAGRPDLTFGILELGTSGSAMAARLSGENEKHQGLAEPALRELREEARELAEVASDTVASRRHDDLQALNDHADWLVARGDYLTRAPGETGLTAEDVESWAARVRGALPDDAVLLSYFVVESRTHVIAMTSSGVETRPTELLDAEAMLLRGAFARECQGRFPTDALDVSAARLLAPVCDLLTEARRVIVIPSQSVNGLPFHAMSLDGEPLGAHRRVVYATRGDELLERQGAQSTGLAPGASWTGLAAPSAAYAGLEDLPAVRPEVERIAALFEQPNAVVDPPARAADLFGIEGHVDLLHVACHGDFDPSAPLLSRLMLADRPVFAFELMLARLDVERVVLSACDTGTGDAGRGGHVHSLATAFLRAGARGVLAALWPVDDAAAADCIDQLYSELVGGAVPLADALCDAQRVVREQEPTSHPYFWAPFVVFGAHEAR